MKKETKQNCDQNSRDETPTNQNSTAQKPEQQSQNLSYDHNIGVKTENRTHWRALHRDMLKCAFAGDMECVRCIEILGRTARVLDDLNDNCYPMENWIEQQAIENLVFELPMNTFFNRHREQIIMFLTIAMSAWRHSNEIEQEKKHDLLTRSYCWRDTINELVGLCIFLHSMDTLTEDGTPASIVINEAREISAYRMKNFREFYAHGSESLVEYMNEHMGQNG